MADPLAGEWELRWVDETAPKKAHVSVVRKADAKGA